MIKLNIQIFAKSSAYQSDRRKAKARSEYSQKSSAKQSDDKQEKKEGSAKSSQPKAGEAVSSVKADEKYQVFVYENNKVRPYTDKDGKNVYRTGAQISDKMIYNKNREAWESKAQLAQKKRDGLGKIRKYIVKKLR